MKKYTVHVKIDNDKIYNFVFGTFAEAKRLAGYWRDMNTDAKITACVDDATD